MREVDKWDRAGVHPPLLDTARVTPASLKSVSDQEAWLASYAKIARDAVNSFDITGNAIFDALTITREVTAVAARPTDRFLLLSEKVDLIDSLFQPFIKLIRPRESAGSACDVLCFDQYAIQATLINEGWAEGAGIVFSSEIAIGPNRVLIHDSDFEILSVNELHSGQNKRSVVDSLASFVRQEDVFLIAANGETEKLGKATSASLVDNPLFMRLGDDMFQHYRTAYEAMRREGPMDFATWLNGTKEKIKSIPPSSFSWQNLPTKSLVILFEKALFYVIYSTDSDIQIGASARAQIRGIITGSPKKRDADDVSGDQIKSRRSVMTELLEAVPGIFELALRGHTAVTPASIVAYQICRQGIYTDGRGGFAAHAGIPYPFSLAITPVSVPTSHLDGRSDPEVVRLGMLLRSAPLNESTEPIERSRIAPFLNAVSSAIERTSYLSIDEQKAFLSRLRVAQF